MSVSVEVSSVAEVVENALRPLKVKFAVFVALLTAVAVAVVSIVSVVALTAGIGEAATTGVILSVIAWFATGSVRNWFGRYANFRSWVERRTLTLSFPGSSHLVGKLADEIAVTRDFTKV